MASKKRKKINNTEPNTNRQQNNHVSTTPATAIKHNSGYLSNNINRIRNIALNRKINNIELLATNSKYMESEKNGMTGFVKASEMLNAKVLKELDTIMVLKDNYKALEEKLKFDVDLKSELLDYSTLNLSLLATNSQFIKQYERNHPCIPGRTYTKEEAEELYGKYFKDPNISGFLDMFYNEKNDTYTVPDIVFDKHDETSGLVIKTTVTKYEIKIDTTGFNKDDIYNNFLSIIDSLDPNLNERLTTPQKAGLTFIGKGNITKKFTDTIHESYSNGVLTIDITDLISLLNDLDDVANGNLGGAATDQDRQLIKEAIAGLEALFVK